MVGLKNTKASSKPRIKAQFPPNVRIDDRAPTTNDYFNFSIGDIWINKGTQSVVVNDIYMLTNQRVNSVTLQKIATWTELAVGDAIQTLTGDTGGAVPGNAADNINLLGTVNRVSVAGNPGTNTLTWNLDATVPSYTTGTWTPTLSFGGSSVGITYGLQSGFWSRINTLVIFSGGIILTNKGAQVGAALINGLPFTMNAANPTVFVGQVASHLITFGAGYTYLWSKVNSGTTNMNIVQGGSGAGQLDLTDAAFANTSAISLTGFYYTT